MVTPSWSSLSEMLSWPASQAGYQGGWPAGAVATPSLLSQFDNVNLISPVAVGSVHWAGMHILRDTTTVFLLKCHCWALLQVTSWPDMTPGDLSHMHSKEEPQGERDGYSAE